MVSFKNFSSVDVANAHKQCSLDPPYTCIYLGVEKIEKKKKDLLISWDFPW